MSTSGKGLRDGRDDPASSGQALRDGRDGRNGQDDSASSGQALLDAARAWLEQDPDPVTRAELESIVGAAESGSAAHLDDLQNRFATRLQFGTAGLRGELGAGPNRMNRVLVAQAAAGLARFLLERETRPNVVIGFDARTNSDVFARDTAELMAGAGVRAILLPRALPTPVLAFAVRHLDASAGVMVTASHNPPRDNGYKVYLGGSDQGSQIVSPDDERIQSQILQVAAGDIRSLPRSTQYEIASESVVDEYIARTAAIAPAEPRKLSFVYTAMHGVGWETARRVFTAAGFGEPHVVHEQIDPDPAFPTVAFPNPEEPGAMDLALAAAAEHDADLVVANDPDADRLAIAIPDAAGWRRLSGNEIGTLLGWRAAERANGQGTLAASLVSSPALGQIARAYGLDHVETLTGFKWISRAPGLVYGYEEALGYLVDPQKVRDKDGISSAVDFLAMAAELKAEGRTVADRLREFAARFGAFASGQVSIRVTRLAEIERIMSRLRDDPPTALAGSAIERFDDFANGFEDLPPSDVLRFRLAGGSRVIVRPSGTEPKVKIYIDASSTEGDPDERMATANATVTGLEKAVRELFA